MHTIFYRTFVVYIDVSDYELTKQNKKKMITREQWLKETQIRKQLREADVIIYKLSSARITCVDYNWNEYVDMSEYSFEDYEKQLINLCWSQVSPRTKTMTIKYMCYNGDGSYTEDYKPTKHKR